METEDERLDRMNTSRRGALVICRDYKGRALVRRVWSETSDAVYIHSEEEYQKHAEGLHCRSCIGFPIEDAFVYDDAAFDAYDTPELWERLRSWKTEARDGQ